MLTLNDGRSELWQWDTNRKLNVDAECSQVHFSNKVFGRSIDMDVVDGVAEIPDILLQTDRDLTAWAFVGTPENGYTKISKVFKVNKRNKPADYVFTPPEQTTLAEIMERLDNLESIQDPDAIKNAVDDYLANNPITVKETDPTVSDWAKEKEKPKYTADEVGALSKTELSGAVNDALAQAKESGEFDGPSGPAGPQGEQGKDGEPGKDYVLTPEDKAEIAEMAAGLVEVPDSGGNVELHIGPDKPTNGALYWLDTSADEPSTPDVPEKTLTSISAVYSGGNVTVGTAVTDLTGIVVTAHYSDGSTETVTDYTLSGTIAEGSNTVTVAYQNMTATFTVTGVAESGGEEKPEPVTYTITNNLTNVTSNNSTASVEENASYTATLTAASGYELDTVTVTMGGTNVTSTVYADGVVTISAVTGDVVIAATGIAQTDNNLEESNIIIESDSPASENDVAKNEEISSSEYVYYLKYPTSSYQKKISIRATYTYSYGYAHIINEMTVNACNNGDSDIAIEAYDHFDDRGYVVFKVHIPTLLGKYQSMIDDGTLDTTKGTRCYFHFEYTKAGYILSDYFG